MAIFHCTISNISRSRGSSVCATAAYITGEKVYEERTGQSYEYGRKQRIDFYEVLLPDGVPEIYKSVSVLSNAIENFEKRDDSRPAKKEEFALPKEATRDQKIAIAQKHINACYVSKGYPCIWSLHDINGENPHAHVIIINRKLDEAGNFEKHKTKTVYARDENDEKIPVYETKRDDAGKIMKDKNGRRILALDADGQPIQSRDKNGKLLYKRTKVEESYLDQKDLVKSIRKNCEECINEYLEGGEKVDCRTLKAQGVDRIPTVHEGYAARGMEAHGEVSERCELNRAIATENARRIVTQLRTSIEMLGERLTAAMEKILNHHGAPNVSVNHHEPHAYDPEFDYAKDPEAILSALSDNPMIHALITSQTYELTSNNLKAVAQTVACLQKQNIDSYSKYKEVYSTLTDDINRTLNDYNSITKKMNVANQKMVCRKTMNKNKDSAKEYFNLCSKTDIISKRKAKNYYAKHSGAIDAYTKARQYIEQHSDGQILKSSEIKKEITDLRTKQSQIRESFVSMRIEGWDLFYAYKNVTAVLGPDETGWHPVNTLDYKVGHDIPDELKVHRGHDINSIYNPREEERRTKERERKRKKTRGKEEPSL